MSTSGIELVVDVHHDDPGIDRFLDHRYQRFRIRRRDHERIDLRHDHLLDNADLVGGIGFVLDAVRDQRELVGVVGLIVLGTGFHRQEKLVRERLHHECDGGFFRCLSECR